MEYMIEIYAMKKMHTASAITPVTMPVLRAVDMYSPPNARWVIEIGFSPFFRCPICLLYD